MFAPLPPGKPLRKTLAGILGGGGPHSPRTSDAAPGTDRTRRRAARRGYGCTVTASAFEAEIPVGGHGGDGAFGPNQKNSR